VLSKNIMTGLLIIGMATPSFTHFLAQQIPCRYGASLIDDDWGDENEDN
jgi:hypothetical protein